MRFRSILFLVMLLTVVIVGGVMTLYLYRAMYRITVVGIERELRGEAILISQLLIGPGGVPEPWTVGDPLDEKVDGLSRDLGVRISVIDLNGIVLADSERDADELRGMENHSDRVEVINALRTGEGQTFRESHTVRHTLLYLARRLPNPPGGVVRVALPVFEIQILWSPVSRAFGIAAAIGALLALALSLFAGRVARQPLANLVRQARALAGASALPPSRREDEVQELSRTLDAVSHEVQVLMQGIATEREQLSSIVQTLTAGLLLLGPDGRVALTNPAFDQLFEVQSPPVGRLLAEIVRQPELLQAAEQARDLRQPKRVKFELRATRPTFVEASLVPLDQPNFRGVLVLFHDVTRLERTERMRKDFVANASHELRTPVSSISACAESMLNDEHMAQPQRTRFLEMILRNCGRLTRLAQDLLDLARAEHDRSKLQLVPVRIGDVVDRVESDLLEPLTARSVKLIRDLAADAETVCADAEALEKILANLLENAIRYSPVGDAVQIRSRRLSPEAVAISVEDHGEGIPEPHLSRIFERFYRVDRARSRQGGGTGLGLAIVKHLVEAQHGLIRVESRPGIRTAFTVELRSPRAAAESS